MRIKSLMKAILARQNYLIRVIEFAEQRSSKAPEGTLTIHRRKNTTDYICVPKGSKNGRPIDKKSNEGKTLINRLAHKSYYLAVVRAAKEEIKLWDTLINRFPGKTFENIYENLSDDRKALIRPMEYPDDEYAKLWQGVSYEPWRFHSEDAVYVTNRGEHVRSKSELLIANRLNEKGIPYRYEYPLQLKNRTFHPDFTILRMSDRQEVYLEHLGKMGDRKYAADNIDKINEYALNGIVQGDKLFFTMETDDVPFNTESFDALIENRLR